MIFDPNICQNENVNNRKIQGCLKSSNYAKHLTRELLQRISDLQNFQFQYFLFPPETFCRLIYLLGTGFSRSKTLCTSALRWPTRWHTRWYTRWHTRWHTRWSTRKVTDKIPQKVKLSYKVRWPTKTVREGAYIVNKWREVGKNISTVCFGPRCVYALACGQANVGATINRVIFSYFLFQFSCAPNSQRY